LLAGKIKVRSLSVEFIILFSLYTIFAGFQYAQLRFNLYVETVRKSQEIFIKLYAIAGIAFLLGIAMIVEIIYAKFEKIMGLYKFAPLLYLVSFYCIPACGYLIIIELH